MNKLLATELQHKLLNILDYRYSKKGYQLKKTVATFSKNGCSIHWGITKRSVDDLIYRPWFVIANPEITRVLSSLFPNSPNDVIIRVQTKQFALENGVNFESPFIYPHPYGDSYYYAIDSESELKTITEDHFRFMEAVTFPFFDKLESLEGIYQYLTSPILSYGLEDIKSNDRKLIKFYNKREVLSSILSAFLIKSPDIHTIVNRFNILLEGNDYILSDFQIICDHFSTR